MADIFHDLHINASPAKVFKAVTSPSGLNSWWTVRSSGEAGEGNTYTLWFGPKYDWRAVVRTAVPNVEIAWEVTDADEDWQGTRLGFHLVDQEGSTKVQFYHTGWKEANEHFRRSSYCWALYLRHLKRFVERGDVVPYDQRYEA